MRLRKLKTSATQLTLANAATAGLGLVSFYVFIRTLGFYQFGEWVLFITAVNLAEMLRTGLVKQALVQRFASGTKTYQNAIKGAAFFFTIVITVLTALLLWVVGLVAGTEANTGVGLFFLAYPIIAFTSLIPSYQSWVAQAEGKFRQLACLNFIPALLLCCIALTTIVYTPTLLELAIAFGTIRLGLSLVLLLTNKRLRKSIKQPNIREIRSLWKFGKYSVTTLLATNLLKSADSFLIGYFIGPAAVALYHIPLKLLEVAEIPARSTGQVLLGQLSKSYAQSDFNGFKTKLESGIGGLIKWYFPMAVLTFFLATPLLQWVGGEPAIEAVAILQVFLIYVVLLPLDRLLGVAIDSTGKPALNAIKVWFMVLINIVGDALVLYYFENITAVAFITVLNIVVGILIGKWLLIKETDITGLLSLNQNTPHAEAA